MRYFCLVFFIIALHSSHLRAQPPIASSPSRIAAIVNHRIITESDLMNRLHFAALSSGLEPTPENLERIKSQMIHVMIDEQLQLGIGDKFEIKIPDEEITNAIHDIEATNGMPEGYITELMAENGIPLSTLKNQIQAQLIWVAYIRAKYPLNTLEDHLNKKHPQDFRPSLQIADWEINQEIKRQEEKNTKTQYHLAEIMIPFEGPDQEERAKVNLTQLIEDLQKGAHFTAIAQQFSQSATAAQGGDMGWLTEDQLVEPEVKEFLSHMNPGQVSSPIRTAQGYKIIAFIDRKLPSAEQDALLTLQQVLLPFPQNFTEEQARNTMEKAKEISLQCKSCPELKETALSKLPEAKAHLSEKEPLSSFPPALQGVLQALPLKTASEPLLTEDGALLVMVCATEGSEVKSISRDEAKALIASQKYSLLARRELRDLKRNAFIDMRI